MHRPQSIRTFERLWLLTLLIGLLFIFGHVASQRHVVPGDVIAAVVLGIIAVLVFAVLVFAVSRWRSVTVRWILVALAITEVTRMVVWGLDKVLSYRRGTLTLMEPETPLFIFCITLHVIGVGLTFTAESRAWLNIEPNENSQVG